jgi:hypothetical protein
MGDVRMVRHTTRTTVTEITFLEKPLEAWQIYCFLPHERLSSQGTFIQSYGCTQYNSKINFYCVQVLQASATLRYALLRQQSEPNLSQNKSPLQFNAEAPPHIYKVHLFMIICPLHKVYETKTQNRRTYQMLTFTRVTICGNLSQKQKFRAECSVDSSNIMHNLHKTEIAKSTIKELQVHIIKYIYTSIKSALWQTIY